MVKANRFLKYLTWIMQHLLIRRFRISSFRLKALNSSIVAHLNAHLLSTK
ncbi:MAG: hypothetical protein AB1480_18235 [Nitrospirota bacterium]